MTTKTLRSAAVAHRIAPELKQEAEQVFTQIGLSPSDAVTLFYKQVVLHHGLPFAVVAAPRRRSGARARIVERLRAQGIDVTEATLGDYMQEVTRAYQPTEEDREIMNFIERATAPYFYE